MKFKVGDFVCLPLKEAGTIVDINVKTFAWFPYKVRITKSTLNEIGDVLEYKEEQMCLEGEEVGIPRDNGEFSDMPSWGHSWREVTNHDYANRRKMRIYQKEFVMLTVVDAGEEYDTKKKMYHVVQESVGIHANGRYYLVDEDKLQEILNS